MRFSVAMCTYNGARHLPEQLRSIAGQTRLPDELVVVDDGSADGSVGVVEAFASEAPFPVRVFRNERNLGYARNFGRAISLVEGDLVLLCDQDDAWHSAKLERFEEALREHPGAGLLFSDAEVVDESLVSLGYGLWDAVEFTPARQEEARRGRAFELLLRGNFVTGATMAFRTEYRDLVLPVDPGSVHDAWVAMLVAAVAETVAIPERLIRYRQHASNQIGIRRVTLAQRVRRARELYRAGFEKHLGQMRAGRERLAGRADVAPERLRHLDEAIEHFAARVGLTRGRLRRVAPVCRELVKGRYARLSNGAISAARDLLV